MRIIILCYLFHCTLTARSSSYYFTCVIWGNMLEMCLLSPRTIVSKTSATFSMFSLSLLFAHSAIRATCTFFPLLCCFMLITVNLRLLTCQWFVCFLSPLLLSLSLSLPLWHTDHTFHTDTGKCSR